MRFGISLFATEYSMPIVEAAHVAEALGFESIFLPEHSHIPVNRRTPWRGQTDMPREYLHSLDPFVALAAVAARTSTLRLGTAVCLVPQRDVFYLAKETATLDQMSMGRLLLGIGAGWNEEEMLNHQIEPATRFTVLAEKAGALVALWTQERAAYAGNMVRFDSVWSWPKPYQRPHPPLMVGGNSLHSLERVVAYGDEWMPIDRTDQRVSEPPIIERKRELDELAHAAHREPIPVTVFSTPLDRVVVEDYIGAGIHRLVFLLPTADEATTIRNLEEAARFVSEYRDVTS